MPEESLVTFGTISVAGLLIMILGLRASTYWRRGLETFGAIVLHIGVFGILYHKVSLILFVSLVSLMLSLFVLIDPLKLTAYLSPRGYRIAGYLLLLTAVAFSAMYLTRFPVWLWAAPIIAYLLPLTLPPLRPKQWFFHALAGLFVLANLSLVAYAVYARFDGNVRFPELVSWFQTSIPEPVGNPVIPGTIVVPLDDGQKTARKTDDASVFSLPDALSGTDEGHAILPVRPAPEGESNTSPPREDIAGLRDADSPRSPLEWDDEEGPFLKGLRKADEEYLDLKRRYERLSRRARDLEDENEELAEKLRRARGGEESGAF